jgi:energy-coupling factor transporter transmembrane protein EcfT
MILILIALVSLTALAVWGAQGRFSFLSGVVSPMAAIVGFISLIAYSVLGFQYFAAEHQSNIINREYGTNYTQIEVFYASNVIDTVRELDRKRIELNGDLVTGK